MLDYFVVSDSMAELIQGVDTVGASGVQGHVPVRLDFVPQLTSYKALGIRKPPALPVARIIGPLQKQKGWGEVLRKAQLALNASSEEHTGSTEGAGQCLC